MKLAYVNPRYAPYIGGIESQIQEVSERLVKMGYDICVLTTDPTGKLEKEEEINGVLVKRFRSLAPRESYYFSSQLRSYLKRNSAIYDIVHAHNYHAFPSLYAAEAKKSNRLVFTPHYHGTGHSPLKSLLHKPYRFVARSLFEKAEKIVCVSDFERRMVLRDFCPDLNKIEVIPNGVNIHEFEALPLKRKKRNVILSVTRLEKYKGTQYLIAVLPKLTEKKVLEIVGKGPYKDNLIALAKNLGVLDRVNFSENLPRPALLQKYVEAEVFCLLSEHEAYGIAVAEALAARTPCIVLNASGLAQWIDNKSCWGIELPVELNKLASLIDWVAGRKIGALTQPAILDWGEVSARLSRLYVRLTETGSQ